jgi:hypothetical protein
MIEGIDEDDLKDTVVPITKVNELVLLKVIEFLVHHSMHPLPEIAKPIKSNDMKVIVGEWYGNFIDTCDKQMVYGTEMITTLLSQRSYCA